MLRRRSLAALGLALLLPGPAWARIEARFAPETDVLGATRVELASTKKRLDLVLPDLAGAELVSLATELARNGRAVRVLTSGGSQSVAGGRCKPCDALEAAGADVRWVAAPLKHHFAIIDGPRGRKDDGSKSRLAMLTDAVDPREGASVPAALVTLRDQGDTLLAYQDEFNFLWAKARDYKSRARNTKQAHVRVPAASLATFTSANVIPSSVGNARWRFVPSIEAQEGAIARHLVGAMSHAYDSIDVSATSFGRPDVTAALQRALARGVRVRVLLPATELASLRSTAQCGAVLAGRSATESLADECLAALGAAVRYYASGPKGPDAPVMTYVVIDGKRALVGNYGLASTDETAAFGSVLSLRGDAARRYAQTFARQFGAEAPNAKLLAGMPRGEESCAFEPVGLTAPQLLSILTLCE